MATRLAWHTDGTVVWACVATTSSTVVAAAQKDKFNGEENTTAYTTYASSTSLAFNFPSACTIESIKFKSSGSETFVCQVSTDSLYGYDGTWTDVLASTTHTGSTTVIGDYTITTPTSSQWFKFKATNALGSIGILHLFGAYDDPGFEIWDVDETAEFLENYPMSLTDAPNNGPYSDYAEFKIKNTDDAAHTYTVYVLPVKDGGDTIISSYFTIGHDANEDTEWTKVDGDTGYTTASVAAGDFSIPLRVYADFTAVQNTADGYHEFFVKVVEIS